ncbi:sigma-54-dependent Fis family transcriptional regulator [Oceanobacillus sp. J11TS1]|uniref:sigma-54 interaction domain-containing protein n=1 Tax=Oceanobacillus sp. J11TS1 TaxID=2807191 RepID=UPI001B2F2B4D|nr:sigma 54-interacting transcriptional regulator [Oceanobacillus sp. J11TS1]GIO24134.1 RNA polymerase subunit sigma-54 [Oceanobacillus sp. J11TS1]
MNNELELINIELEGILNTSNDNIVVTDSDGMVLRASSNCTSIYGKARDELIGQTVYQLEQEKIFYPSVTAAVLKEKKEVQVMQKTPTGKVIMATGIPIFDRTGKMVRIISFSHDLTEIQRLKEDYEQLQKKMMKYESEIEELREKETTAYQIPIKSKIMQEIYELVNRVARSDANVVFLGESGVGKNVFARALHDGSDRHGGNFIELNCGAIPEALFESEIFGYEPGSFTGASKKGKAGIIELAEGGTLFLDEVAELPVSIQVKLLKVLQEKKVTRIGGSKAKKVDFRLITATNQDLEAMVREKRFRKDLYYRLNVIPITIPPLRDRVDDIYTLAQHYLSIFNKKYKMNKSFHPSTIQAFLEYDWPGNVRELENLIERIVITSPTAVIYPSSIPFIKKVMAKEPNIEEWPLKTFEQRRMTLHQALEEVEKSWLTYAYRQYKTTYEMADYLGLSQSTVVRRLKKYSINSK